MARNTRNWWNRSPGEMEAICQYVEDLMDGGGGASLIHQASMTDDHTQILNWPTGREFIGTPGSGRLVDFRSLAVELNFGADYTSDVTLQAQTLSGDQATPQVVSALPTAVECPSWASITDMGSLSGPLSTFADQAWKVGGHNFETISGGDAGDTAKWSAEFRVWDDTLGRYLTTDESGWNQSTRTFS